MIRFDSHVHTRYSSDSKEEMENMIVRGIELGLEGITFTDHMDIDFPQVYDLPFVFDVKKEQEEINHLRDKYKDSIDLYAGIEMGLQPHIADQILKLTSSYSFDYVIGSVHVVGGLDPYYPEYWNQYDSERKGILTYFERALECVKTCHEYDSLGHLDYIMRYVPSGNSAYSYSEFGEIIDEILKILVEEGKALEINTSGIRKNGYANPCFDVVKRYKELGGQYITFGSDAHEAAFLASDFQQIATDCKKNGLDSYVVYKNRKPISYSIL